jgi:hypothetical protein
MVNDSSFYVSLPHGWVEYDGCLSMLINLDSVKQACLVIMFDTRSLKDV